MTINDPEAFCAGLWDWAILDGCFGDTAIMPSRGDLPSTPDLWYVVSTIASALCT